LFDVGYFGYKLIGKGWTAGIQVVKHQDSWRQAHFGYTQGERRFVRPLCLELTRVIACML
jgi:hypothetical protein